MAMAITAVGEEMHAFGDMKARVIDVDITSYINPGGEPLAAADVGFTRLDMVSPIGREVLDLDLKWIAGVVRLTVMSTGAEAANASDGGVWRLLVIGK